MNPEQLDWLTESELGPLLHQLAPLGFEGPPRCSQKLWATDLKSRVLMADLQATSERTSGLLNDMGVEPIEESCLRGNVLSTPPIPALYASDQLAPAEQPIGEG